MFGRKHRRSAQSVSQSSGSHGHFIEPLEGRQLLSVVAQPASKAVTTHVAFLANSTKPLIGQTLVLNALVTTGNNSVPHGTAELLDNGTQTGIKIHVKSNGKVRFTFDGGA